MSGYKIISREQGNKSRNCHSPGSSLRGRRPKGKERGNAREAREGRTREDRAHFDFPPFLRPAMQAIPEPANFLILFSLYSFQKMSSHPLSRGKTQF